MFEQITAKIEEIKRNSGKAYLKTPSFAKDEKMLIDSVTFEEPDTIRIDGTINGKAATVVQNQKNFDLIFIFDDNNSYAEYSFD